MGRPARAPCRLLGGILLWAGGRRGTARALERPEESGDASQNELLWAWMRERGAQVYEGMAPAPIGDGGLWGMKAMRSIERDVELLRVPAAMILPVDLDHESSPDVPADLLRSIPDNFPTGTQVASVQLSRLFDGSGDAEVRARWQPYLEKLRALGSWQQMPDFVDAFQQSPLRELALYQNRWAQASLDASGRDSRMWLNRSSYLHANWCLISRVHGTDNKDGRGLVPGGDLFNHQFHNNARWTYKQGPPGYFVVSAARAIEEGEEILVSYGEDKSNAEMMAHYGFTNAPYWEPAYSFELFMEEAPDGSLRAPGFEIGERTQVLKLRTVVVLEGMGPRNLHGGLAAFAAAHNASWQRELRRHLEFHLRRYDGDASLAPLREAWRANRERNPKTPVWWTPLPSCRSEYGTASEDTDCSADRDLSAELAGGSFVALSVLRVKMSEYVALTAHIEMLDILEGSRSWKTSLMTATGLSEALPDALKKRQQAMFEKMATDSRVPATTPDAPTEPLGPAGVGYSCLVVALMCSVALLLVLRHRPCRTKQKH